MSVRLHINIDHVATVRNARGTSYPDPVDAAEICLSAGADGITAHLREDRRHIVDSDVVRLRALAGRSSRTFNLEMAATDEMVAIALRVMPDVCTLVPERREERTTEGGLDVVAGGESLARHIAVLGGAGIKVSLFIAPDLAQIDRSVAVGARQVEFHTGEYAHGGDGELTRLGEAVRRASRARVDVAAGHGLTRSNVPALVALGGIEELNIGHAVVSDAVMVGMGPAVRAFRDAIERGLRAR
jgi:pyridoxine 5-phosphate synthase